MLFNVSNHKVHAQVLPVNLTLTAFANDNTPVRGGNISDSDNASSISQHLCSSLSRLNLHLTDPKSNKIILFANQDLPQGFPRVLRVKSDQLLGVIIDYKLNFDLQVDNVAKKANFCIYFILKN